MSDFIDRIENAAHKATNYLEEHPWAAIACGLWPVHVDGPAALGKELSKDLNGPASGVIKGDTVSHGAPTDKSTERAAARPATGDGKK